MTLKRFSATAILFLMILLLLSAFALLSLRNGEIDFVALLMGFGVAGYVLFQYNMLRRAFPQMDRFVLLTAQFLYSFGLVILYRMSPSTAIKQLAWVLAGSAAMIIAMQLVCKTRNFGRVNWIFMAISLGMLLSTAVMGSSIGGARNWLSIGPLSVQPSEFSKLLFIIISAYFLTTRETIVSFLPYIAYTAACVLILVWERDLGAALLICGTFLILFFAATRRFLLTGVGIGVFAVGAVAAAKIFPHVKTRVEVWKNPWAYYNGSGYQVVQGLMAIAAGGVFGTGLGLGMPEKIPVGTSDYIFAVIAEEFGVGVGIFIILVYLIFIVRGVLIALNARTKFDALLVFGCCSMLTLQSFIIIGGVIKLIPLTGITLPFVSYGGSSMLSSMLELGIIEGIALKNGARDEGELVLMGGVVE